jgi:hypothetical protein
MGLAFRALQAVLLVAVGSYGAHSTPRPSRLPRSDGMLSNMSASKCVSRIYELLVIKFQLT